VGSVGRMGGSQPFGGKAIGGGDGRRMFMYANAGCIHEAAANWNLKVCAKAVKS
jgi:hypothetical protein